MDNGLINNDFVEINPPMEDLFPSKPLCTCKKCVVGREIDELLETECTCTYKDVEKTDTWIDENGVEQSNTYTVTEVDVKCQRCIDVDCLKDKLDKYDVLEKANINEVDWDLCSIVDGIIYTGTTECPHGMIDIMNARIDATEEAVMGLLIDGVMVSANNSK